MKVIGITGGVGAGKSIVLKYINENYHCRIIFADEVGNEVKKQGHLCYQRLVSLLGKEVLDKEGSIDKNIMAKLIFNDYHLREKVNAIIHPAVEEYILSQINMERNKKEVDFFFIEAALLIECGYEAYVDELWYIYADEETRKIRLKENRQYSEEKIRNIMNGQLSEEIFRKHCLITINNGQDFEDTKMQIDAKLGEELWKMQKNTQDN